MTSPAAAIRACSACHLRQSCSGPVPGVGLIPSPLMVIGEAPGAEEDEKGIPWVGKAGRLLTSMLKTIGYSREATYITNVVKCRPVNNATPTPAMMKSCSRWLDLEISLVQPRIIVAAGATAIRRILGADAGTVEHLHSKPRIVDFPHGPVVVLPTYHPAATLYDTAQLRLLYDDFQVLKGLLAGESPSSFLVADAYPNPKYLEVTSPSDVALLLHLLYKAGRYSLDLETVGGELWSTQVSVEPGTAFFVGPEFIDTFVRGLRDVHSEAIVHNYLHDANFVELPRFVDTMVMAYLLGLPQGLKELASRICGMEMKSYQDLVSPGRRAKVTKYLEMATTTDWPAPEPVIDVKWDNKAGRTVEKIRKPKPINQKIKRILADSMDNPDVDSYHRWHDIDERERANVEEKLGVMPDSTIADIDHASAVAYACRDADATLRAYDEMAPHIAALGLDFILHLVDLPALPMVLEMMKSGVALDIDHLRNLSTDYGERMVVSAEKAATKVGHPFNPNSSAQVANVVYGELGFKPTRSTPSGGISTDDRELKKIKHPVIADILEYRRLAKNKDSFADALLEKATQGRIHTTLKATRTETGRLSSSNPNLQAMPVRSAEGRQIRRGFIASPSKRLLTGDYDQEEMKLMAHESRCKAMIELFLRGGDVHTETAARIFGIPLEKAKETRYRYPTKRLNFGVVYDITAEGLAEDIGEWVSELNAEDTSNTIVAWTVEECARLIKEWYQLYPEVRDFRMEKIAQARRYGYVTDMFGRIRFVPEVLCPIRSIQEAGARQAGNMPIQSGSAGIIKLAMASLWRSRTLELWNRIRFLLQIHDELLLEVDDDDRFVSGCAKWLTDTMSSVVSLSIPLTVSIKSGYNWADLKELQL